MREPTTRRLLFRSPQPEAGDATGISSLVSVLRGSDVVLGDADTRHEGGGDAGGEVRVEVLISATNHGKLFALFACSDAETDTC